MKNKKTFLFCALLCIVLLVACFSSWDGSSGENIPLQYTVTLTDSDGKSIEVETTRTPIVISVPKGEWDIFVKVDATEDDGFAGTRQRFLGTKKIDHDKEETIALDIDINEMTPAIQVKNWGQLSKAFGGWDKYLKEAGWKPNGKPQYIELLENTSANDTPATLDGDSNTNIVLWTDEDVKIEKGMTGNLFQIKKGTLTLGGSGKGKITIEGNGKDNNRSLITVSGTLIMNEGVTLTGNTANNKNRENGKGNGGGVFVDIGGEFIMKGGTIFGNTSDPSDGLEGNAGGGGGVYVHGDPKDNRDGGKFTMYGGSIFNNTTTGHGGGVRVFEKGKFIMEGGEIHKNNSVDYGGGVRVRGTFTMKDGSIYENTSKGGSSNSSDGHGGGVGVADTGDGTGSFFMEGGIIRNNTATGYASGVGVGYGGGVYVGKKGIFTKTGGTISNNIPDDTSPQ